MENQKLKIKPIDMEDIALQAKQIAGLAQVFEISIACEDEGLLPNAFQCLTDLAFEHQDDCINLLNQFYKSDKD